jgi:hypothetical protein
MTHRPKREFPSESKVQKFVDRIRDRINARRRVRRLSSDAPLWAQLCSALDVIGDSELAIIAFSRKEAAPLGEMYLLLYGLLQAVVLQQDAVLHAAKALDVAWTRPSEAKTLRAIRNRTAGHPTSFTHGEPRFNHIVRTSSSIKAFDLMSWSSNGDGPSSETVATAPLLAEHRDVVISGLSTILAAELRREAAHRQQFCHEKLAPLFRSHLAEVGVVGPPFAKAQVATHAISVLEQVERIRVRLEARDEFFGELLDDTHVGLCGILRRLFTNQRGACEGKEYGDEAIRRLNDFTDILDELDAEYDESLDEL